MTHHTRHGKQEESKNCTMDMTDKIDQLESEHEDVTSPEALYKLYPLELTTTQKSKPDEPAEELQESNTSEVELSEDKNDSSLSGDCRPRRKAFTHALKCLNDTLHDDEEEF